MPRRDRRGLGMLRVSKLLIAVVAIIGIEAILFFAAAARGLADTTLSYYFFSVLLLELVMLLLMAQARNRHARAGTR